MYVVNLSPVVTNGGVDQHLHQCSDQEQVWHTHMELIDEKVVGSEESSGYKCKT